MQFDKWEGKHNTPSFKRQCHRVVKGWPLASVTCTATTSRRAAASQVGNLSTQCWFLQTLSFIPISFLFHCPALPSLPPIIVSLLLPSFRLWVEGEQAKEEDSHVLTCVTGPWTHASPVICTLTHEEQGGVESGRWPPFRSMLESGFSIPILPSKL